MLALPLIALALLAQAAPTTQPTSRPSTQPAEADWKQAVLDRSGIDVWPSVTRLKFTFNVDARGRNVSRSHDWDLRTGLDTITRADGSTISVNVWAYDQSTASPDKIEAFQQWTNDSYWLLMPLKLGDPGVQFGPVVTTRDMPPSRANVTMSFEDGTGLTSGDEYDLAIDLREGVIDGWTFRPNADTAVTWSWQDYQDFNGLYLSTNHVNEQPDGPRIFFTDIEVERE